MTSGKPGGRAGLDSRFAAVAKWSSVPAALVLSSALVWHAWYSAFSATTDNPASNWSAGSVALSDDDSNTALFSATNLKPGATGTKCIVVSSTGSLPASVRLYGTSPATTLALSTYLDLVVDEGTGGTFAGSGPSSRTGFTSASNAYTGTLAAFGTGKTNFASEVGTWAPAAGNQTRTYRFAYTVNSTIPNSAQGGTAAIGFTWEAQNS
jgi:hypothetical protein